MMQNFGSLLTIVLHNISKELQDSRFLDSKKMTDVSSATDFGLRKKNGKKRGKRFYTD
jgi:hypothetical protein